MSASIVLDPTPSSVAMARRWSEQVLARFGADDLADTTTLLVSELVTNVVLHAQTPCSVRIDGGGGRLRVEVADGSDHLPVRGDATDVLALSGRGMFLVEGLSEACGVDAEPLGGKRIWFELLAPTLA